MSNKTMYEKEKEITDKIGVKEEIKSYICRELQNCRKPL